MPRKIGDLLRDLSIAGFLEVKGGGKGSHRKFVHNKCKGMVTISGRDGDDALHYQEKQAIESINE